ncbi:MAG TPA: peptide-methionine (R)-S-oxide reductase MsrB [Mycobacteriales bacterium]|jgi:peptide-methionine (R)-S-oxide reductase|nr:peptide-methionine (R)-S-oxide reductase MsrB [Mycobacteriales bacterium]
MTASDSTRFEVDKSDEQWRAELSPAQYAVLRQAGTEPAFAGALTDVEDPGLYRCAACRNPLFRSTTKYHSGSGWPSFWEPLTPDAVVLRPDDSHGMVRTEVLCGQCGSHLGHRFDDGPQPTGQRYCMNSIALDLERDE